MGVVYNFVSWLQDSLIQAMLVELPEDDGTDDQPPQGL